VLQCLKISPILNHPPSTPSTSITSSNSSFDISSGNNSSVISSYDSETVSGLLPIDLNDDDDISEQSIQGVHEDEVDNTLKIDLEVYAI